MSSPSDKDKDATGDQDILLGPVNYTRWHRTFKVDAIAENLWNLFTGQEEIKKLPTRPILPQQTDTLGRTRSGDILAQSAAADLLKDAISLYTLQVSEYKLDRDEYESQQKRSAKAQGLIAKRIDPALRAGLETCTTPKQSFDYVMKLCKLSDSRALDVALQGMETLRYDDCTGMTDFINRLELYRLDIKDLDNEYSVDKLISRILRGLPQQYDNFIDSYHIHQEDPNRTAPITNEAKEAELKNLHTRLLAQESRYARSTDSPNQKSGNNNKKKGSNSNNNKSRDKNDDNRDSRDRNNNRSSSSKQCGHCGRRGHTEDSCYWKHPDKRPKNSDSSDNRNGGNHRSSTTFIKKESDNANVVNEQTPKSRPSSYALVTTADLRDFTEQLQTRFKLDEPLDLGLSLAINTPLPDSEHDESAEAEEVDEQLHRELQQASLNVLINLDRIAPTVFDTAPAMCGHCRSFGHTTDDHDFAQRWCSSTGTTGRTRSFSATESPSQVRRHARRTRSITFGETTVIQAPNAPAARTTLAQTIQGISASPTFQLLLPSDITPQNSRIGSQTTSSESWEDGKGWHMEPEYRCDEETVDGVATARIRGNVMAILKDGTSDGLSSWIMDSGATLCIVKDRSLFTDFRSISYNVGTANDPNALRIEGGGKILIHLINENNDVIPLSLSNVAYAPSARFNILSLSYLAEKGGFNGVWSTGGITIVDKDGFEVGRGQLHQGLYYLNVANAPSETQNNADVGDDQSHQSVEPDLEDTAAGPGHEVFILPPGVRPPHVVAEIDFSEPVLMWHRRLGHLGLTNLRALLKSSEGIDLTDKQIQEKLDVICPVCATTKALHHVPKDPATRRETEVGGLIHLDSWGPYPRLGLNRELWILAFTDDATRYTWTTSYERKSEALEKIQNLHRMIETTHNTTIRKYRLDGEFSKIGTLQQWASKKGITIQPTVPYEHFMNGIAERGFRTEREKASAMMREANLQNVGPRIMNILDARTQEKLRETSLPESLWPAAFQHAVWLKNRSPTRALKNKKTPWEALTTYKPDLKNEKVFGSRVYVSIPPHVRTQNGKDLHQPRAIMGYFVGFAAESKMRIYVPDKNQILESQVSRVDDGQGLDDPQDAPSRQERPTEPTQRTDDYNDEDSEDEDDAIDTPNEDESEVATILSTLLTANILVTGATATKRKQSSATSKAPDSNDNTSNSPKKKIRSEWSANGPGWTTQHDQAIVDIWNDNPDATYPTKAKLANKLDIFKSEPISHRAFRERLGVLKKKGEHDINSPENETDDRWTKEKDAIFIAHYNDLDLKAKGKYETMADLLNEYDLFSNHRLTPVAIQSHLQALRSSGIDLQDRRWSKEQHSLLMYYHRTSPEDSGHDDVADMLNDEPAFSDHFVTPHAVRGQLVRLRKGGEDLPIRSSARQPNSKWSKANIELIVETFLNDANKTNDIPLLKSLYDHPDIEHAEQMRQLSVHSIGRKLNQLRRLGRIPFKKHSITAEEAIAIDLLHNDNIYRKDQRGFAMAIVALGAQLSITVGNYSRQRPNSLITTLSHNDKDHIEKLYPGFFDESKRGKILELLRPINDNVKKACNQCRPVLRNTTTCTGCSRFPGPCNKCLHKNKIGTLSNANCIFHVSQGVQHCFHPDDDVRKKLATDAQKFNGSCRACSLNHKTGCNGELPCQNCTAEESTRNDGWGATYCAYPQEDGSVLRYTLRDTDKVRARTHFTEAEEQKIIASRENDEYGDMPDSEVASVYEGNNDDGEDDFFAFFAQGGNTIPPPEDGDAELNAFLENPILPPGGNEWDFLGPSLRDDQPSFHVNVVTGDYLDRAADTMEANVSSHTSFRNGIRNPVDTSPTTNHKQRRAIDKLEKQARKFDRAIEQLDRPTHRFECILAQELRAHGPEPNTLRQARRMYDAKQWEQAAHEEYSSLREADTWKVVKRPWNRKVLRSRWVFKRKMAATGKIAKYKARFVVKGFTQIYGLDFDETYASVVKAPSYRLLFALQARFKWKCHQMDIKTAFLNGNVEHEIYVEPPEGFPEDDDKVLLLKRSLYGLKQSPRLWYLCLRGFLEEIGWKASEYDQSVFIHPDGMYLGVYVDDLLIFGPDEGQIQRVKDQLANRFQMTDLGRCSYYLGIHIHQDDNGDVYLHQSNYLQQIIQRFGLQGSRTFNTPMDPKAKMQKNTGLPLSLDQIRLYQSKVGSLNYAMIETRPDIAEAVGVLSQYCSNPTNEHIQAVDRVFGYMQQTTELGLRYKHGASNDLNLQIFVDADWGGELDTRKSTTGWVAMLAGAAISWSSKRQKSNALSTMEAEYIAASAAAQEAIWLRNFILELNLPAPVMTDSKVPILIDNDAALRLTRNPENHGRAKHIEIRHHFIRQTVAEGKVHTVRVASEDNTADILTKPLARDVFEKHVHALGMVTVACESGPPVGELNLEV